MLSSFFCSNKKMKVPLDDDTDKVQKNPKEIKGVI